jgi:hypothetical protein
MPDRAAQTESFNEVLLSQTRYGEPAGSIGSAQAGEGSQAEDIALEEGKLIRAVVLLYGLLVTMIFGILALVLLVL